MKNICFLQKILVTVFLFIFLCQFAAAGEIKHDGKIIDVKKAGKIDGVNISKVIYYSSGFEVNGLFFLPAGAKKLPCVIFCHDGISGISKEHRLSSVRIAKAGYAVFAPSYRGEDKSEGEIEIAKGEVDDVLNAIKVVSQIKQVDKKNIALAGASHGALICILAASRTDKIKGVVSAYGVADIYKWWDYLKKNNKIGTDRITRQTYGNGPQDRPVSFAIRNAVSVVKNIKCPVLILQGEKDDIVPPQQAKFLKAALDKYKIPNTLKIYPDCLHGFLVYAPYINDVEKEEKLQTEEAWGVMLGFFKKHLKKDSI